MLSGGTNWTETRKAARRRLFNPFFAGLRYGGRADRRGAEAHRYTHGRPSPVFRLAEWHSGAVWRDRTFLVAHRTSSRRIPEQVLFLGPRLALLPFARTVDRCGPAAFPAPSPWSIARASPRARDCLSRSSSFEDSDRTSPPGAADCSPLARLLRDNRRVLRWLGPCGDLARQSFPCRI